MERERPETIRQLRRAEAQVQPGGSYTDHVLPRACLPGGGGRPRGLQAGPGGPLSTPSRTPVWHGRTHRTKQQVNKSANIPTAGQQVWGSGTQELHDLGTRQGQDERVKGKRQDTAAVGGAGGGAAAAALERGAWWQCWSPERTEWRAWCHKVCTSSELSLVTHRIR